jgi:SAM-dependent methyltransferase
VRRLTDNELEEKEIQLNNKFFFSLLKRQPDEWFKTIGIYKGDTKLPSAKNRSNFYKDLSKGWERPYIFAHFFRFSYIRRLTRGPRYNNAYGKKTILLDLGCGEGLLRNMLYRNAINIKYIGIDIALQTLKKALNLKSKEEAIYLRYDLNKGIPLNDNSVNIVVAFEIIEHLLKKSGLKVIRESYRVLKKNGILILSTPIQPFAENLYEDEHIYEWKKDEIEKEYLKLGFNIELIRGISIRTKHLKEELKNNQVLSNLYLQLSKHFEGSILNCFFAVFFPDKSYNVMWILKK